MVGVVPRPEHAGRFEQRLVLFDVASGSEIQPIVGGGHEALGPKLSDRRLINHTARFYARPTNRHQFVVSPKSH